MVTGGLILKVAEKSPHLTAHFALALERGIVADTSLQDEFGKWGVTVELHLLMVGSVEDLAWFLWCFALLPIEEAPMDEVCLYDMLGDVLHEVDEPCVPNMQNYGNADDIFSMHLES